MPTIRTFCALFTAAAGLYASAGNQPLFPLIRNNDMPALKQQIAAGIDVNGRGDRNTTPLMYAAAFGSADAVSLLLKAGADVNAKNDFGATALMWGIQDAEKVRLLVNRGADVNAVAKNGTTPLLLACSQDSTEDTVRLLIRKGADVKAKDKSGLTTLSAAAGADNLPVVRILLGAGVDVNAKSMRGSTALINGAAAGNPEIVRALLAAGADPKAVSGPPGQPVKNGIVKLGNFTALHLAATYGPPEVVSMLVDAGADVNAKEARGMTPLLIAATGEKQNPRVFRTLLDKGADPAVKMETGETAADWAAKFNHPECTKLLPGGKSDPVSSAAGHRAPSAQAAAQRSVDLLQKASASFFTTGGCVGCHAQNITAMVVEVARKQGLKTDDAAIAEQKKQVKGMWSFQGDGLLLRDDPPGGVDMIVYSLFELAAEGYQPDFMTDAMIHNVAAQQTHEGHWAGFGLARVPVEDSDFSRTAMVVRALQVFGSGGRRAEFDARIQRAATWLKTHEPAYSEDRTWKLLGLKWAGADSATLQKAAKDLLSRQNADGGWAQSDHLAGDAYATGQVLYALHETGQLETTDAAYRRGVAYLMNTQAEDGSWHVKSRALKFQPYFKSGFPYDHDQWISSMGTGWAAMALAFSADASGAPALE